VFPATGEAICKTVILVRTGYTPSTDEGAPEPYKWKEDMPKFTLLHNDQTIKTFTISEPVITIGRLPENTIPIANMSVSRRHVRIEKDTDNVFSITDLNSLNGTLVNNIKVSKSSLNPGDCISVGVYSLIFELDEDAQKKPSPTSKSREKATSPGTPDKDNTEKHRELSSHGTKTGLGVPVLIETTKHVVYKLDREAFTIGNSEDDDIFIDGMFIENGHAGVFIKDGKYWIETQKFMGKFRVNGKKNRLHCLHHKDRIEIGTSTFRYMENE